MCKKKKKREREEKRKKKETSNHNAKITIFWSDVVTSWIFAILLRWTDIDLLRVKKITKITIYWLIFVV